MPNTLTEKAIAQPFRVGLMLGALSLPSLWTLSQDVLSLLTNKPLLNSEEITNLFAIGFLPGMVLGAGLVQAWVRWREDRTGEARWLLIGHSAFVALPCFLFSLGGARDTFSQFSTGGWGSVWQEVALNFYFNFPLQCALAMLLFGLFMRNSRA